VLTGTVLLDDSGEGPQSVGTIRLATASGIFDLDYAEPLERHFVNEACWDIGAIWSVEVELVDSEREITKATCAGQVNEAVHGAWLVVRAYMQAIGDGKMPLATLFSSRWRTSRSYQDYLSNVKGLDGSTLRFHGRPGRCLEVTKIEPDRIQFRSDNCFIRIAEKHIAFTIDVVSNVRNFRWEIDGIQNK
jgi:hypothetical protein